MVTINQAETLLRLLEVSEEKIDGFRINYANDPRRGLGDLAVCAITALQATVKIKTDLVELLKDLESMKNGGAHHEPNDPAHAEAIDRKDGLEIDIHIREDYLAELADIIVAFDQTTAH